MCHNADFTVYLDDRMVYRHESVENLTGRGYDDMRVIIPLTHNDLQKDIRIELKSVFNEAGDHSGGTARIEFVSICPVEEHTSILTTSRMLPALLSLLIIFMGTLLVCVYFFVPEKHLLPFNVAALGLLAFLLGFWCLNQTGLLQLMLNSSIGFRMITYMVPLLCEYPMVCFVNSYMVKKQDIYPRIIFYFWIVSTAALFFFRFALGYDMHSLMWMLNAEYAIVLGFLTYIVVKDIRYCRQFGIERNRRYFELGSVSFAVCILLEIIYYFFGRSTIITTGNFIRIGLCIFFFEMLLQFMYWWSGEHERSERSIFMNQILQYAVSSRTPEKNIQYMIDYLGQNMNAKRAFIFEKGHDDVFRNTYKWCEGETYLETDHYDHIPYESEDIICSPLEINGMTVGFCGIKDLKGGHSKEDAAETVKLLSYFFSQLILQRNNTKQLISYGYNDLMTGAGNRRAYEQFESTSLDKNGTFGYIMCDINGLKMVNDTLGHEAGDMLIKDVCDSLILVFKKKHVYRLGGDEFAAFSFDTDENGFNDKVEIVKNLIIEKGRSASIGAVFCTNGNIPYEEMKTQADQLMYAEKDKFYQGKNERRRRR